MTMFSRAKVSSDTKVLANKRHRLRLGVESLEMRALLSGFTDNFEAPTLNAFWTPQVQSGSIALSSVQAHGGSQSLQFNTTNTASGKNVYVEHTFAQPTYGTFSVWLDDTGADINSSNYLYLSVYGTGTHNLGGIGTQDYDLGPGQNGSNYYVNPLDDRISINTGFDRTQGWHQFVIDDTPALATFKIDGKTVGTAVGAPINHVRLAMGGPSWRPAWTSYYDDFQYTPYTPDAVTAITPVTPNPRTTAVPSVDATFSGPIDLSTFTYADMSLTRNGAAVPLSSTVTTALVSGSTYRISGLDTFTTAAGSYVLTVNGAGVKDPAGNAATGTVSTSWTTLPAYTFTPVNPTTAVERLISAYGINDKGQIVGYYFTDASNRYFSFLKDANGYTAIDAASLGAISVVANGINNAGQIVGVYVDASNLWHGFLKDGNNYTSFDPTSLGSVRTIAESINSTGQIVGVYYDSSSHIHSFLKDSTGYTEIAPTSLGATNTDNEAIGINDAGQIVGFYHDSSNIAHGFLKDSSGYHTIDVTLPGAKQTFPGGINNAGQVSGGYIDASNLYHGYLMDSSGYHVTDATLPGALNTRSFGINNFGQFVGSYWGNVAGVQLGGFLATPTTIATATFLKTDTTTKGTWKGNYGVDGFSVSQDSSAIPTYATMTLAGASGHAWAPTTPDPRALLKGALGSTDRIAATWYSSTSMTFDVNITDGKAHQVSLYALDWDKNGRNETIDVIDTLSGKVLNSQTISGFQNGVYLAWTLTGDVTFKVTNNGSTNAVVSGFFFGGAPSTTGSANFLKSDPTTQGTWKGIYGADGFNVSQDPSANNPLIPAYATVTVAGASGYAWAPTTTDPRGLQKAAVTSTDRIAGTWYSSTYMTFDVNITDGKTHQVALYALDWDNNARNETITVSDTKSGVVLDTKTISGFQNGVYLAWTVGGDVTFRVTNNGSTNAVVSGLFFGGAPASSGAAATFVKADSTTRGAWKGNYGADGFNVSQDLSANNPAIPAYASMTIAGAGNTTWVGSTTDARALRKSAAGAVDAIAGCWYGSSYTIDLNLSGTAPHQVALYALDWDGKGRSERIDVIDPSTGTVLSTRNVSSFSGGTYLVWKLTGHVVLKVSLLSGPNAVVSGIFFDPGV